MTKILLLHGPNLNLLGTREPEVYGHFTLQDLEVHLNDFMSVTTQSFGLKMPKLTYFQSNDEKEFIEKCTEATYDAVVLNAGAWTHTSLALADRLKASNKKFIEVHISNVHAREKYRHHSFMSAHALGVVSGLGMYSYSAALISLLLSP